MGLQDFHLHFKVADKTLDFDFKEVENRGDDSVLLNGRYFQLIGDKEDTSWLKENFPQLTETGSTIEGLKADLSTMGAKEVRTSKKIGRVFSKSFVDGTASDEAAFRKKQVLEEMKPRLGPPGFVNKATSIESQMDNYSIFGVGIAVINDFKVEWKAGLGHLEDIDTLVQAASISKSINALTILTLAKEGKIRQYLEDKKLLTEEEAKKTSDLDLDVSKILGDELWKKNDPKGLAKDHPVTIRTLLSHKAGVILGKGETGFDGYPRPEAVKKEINELENRLSKLESSSDKSKIDQIHQRLTFLRSIENGYPTTDQILEGNGPGVNSGPVRVEAEPDMKGPMRYQGGGPMIVQKIIETIVKDQTYSEVVKDKVYSPLKMESTFSPSEGEKTAEGFDELGDRISGGYNVYPELAAAGAWSSPKDLAKVVIEIQKAYNGKSDATIGEDLAKEMLVPKKGLGVAVPPGEGTRYFFHEGANHGFRAVIIGNTDGQGAVIMTNSDKGDVLYKEILDRIIDVYVWKDAEKIDILKPLMDSKEAEAVDRDRWASKSEGKYKFKPEENVELTFCIERNEDKIKGQFTVEINGTLDEERIFEITPLSGSTGCFRKTDNSPYIPFELDINDREEVAGIILFDDPFEKQPS